jgi:hypothetical protein
MKILQQTETKLVIRPRGGLLIAVLGAVFVLMSGVMFYTFGQTSDLQCERDLSGSMQCRLARSLLGIPLSDRPVEALQGAYVSESRDSDGDTTYKIMLVTGGGDIPLTAYTSSGYRKKASLVNDVNRYVEGRASTLNVSQGGTIGMIASAVFLLVSLFFIVSGVQSRFTTWTFDLIEGMVDLHKETLFGIRNRSYSLDDIQNVSVGRSRDSDGDTTYRVELFSNQEGPIPLTGWYSSGYRKKKQAADVIQYYLDQYHTT